MQYIPWIISFCMLLLSFYNTRAGRTDKSAAVLDELKTGVLKLNMKSDQICSTTNETRTDIKAMNSKIIDMDKELSIVKRDLKTAFKQIDDLRVRITKEGE